MFKEYFRHITVFFAENMYYFILFFKENSILFHFTKKILNYNTYPRSITKNIGFFIFLLEIPSLISVKLKNSFRFRWICYI